MTERSTREGGSGQLFSRFEQAVVRPIDAAWLVAMRVLFGVLVGISALRFIAYGWIDEFFVNPQLHFKYWGFAWVEPLSRSGMYGLFWSLVGLSLLVMFGFCFRISAILLVLGFSYLQLIDVTTYLNHYYLVCLLGALLAISPAHRSGSIDAWLWPRVRRSTIAGGWQLLFRFQVGVVYTFAGLAKAHGDWLLRGQPLKIWLSSHTDMALLGPLFRFDATAYAMSWGGFLFDTLVPWFLLWRRTRPYAYAVLVGFHLMVGKLFPIGMFPVIMMVSALVFFPPDWPRALIRRVLPHSQLATSDASALAVAGRPVSRTLLGLGAAYCLLQLVLPLRFLAYGGNVRWHEQGMRFSWRVMVREKNASITYEVRSKTHGRVWHVVPGRYLTPNQEREISGQPDLILQLAHHIERDFALRGKGPVEVRVEALVSLNGRQAALMIDPTVDLTQVQDSLQRAAWILPAPDAAATHPRPIGLTAR